MREPWMRPVDKQTWLAWFIRTFSLCHHPIPTDEDRFVSRMIANYCFAETVVEAHNDNGDSHA